MLSISIPTYKRLRYLQWTVAKIGRDFPDAEIVISDNCSHYDERPIGFKIHWLQQSSNIGAFPNQLAALQAAKGDYAVYCADDDYLLPEQVAIAIEYMDAHPTVAAYCAPCEIWNEVNQTPFWNAFQVPECGMTFYANQGVDLFNFLIARHVWPEHIIYRAPVPLKPRTRAYWAFADIPDILERGAMHFSPMPFYRNLLVHPVGERVQLGNEQCLTHFDEYRAGLEVLAHGLFGGELRYEVRHHIQDMIQSFICARLDVAARLHERSGSADEAQMIRKRLAIASPVRDVA